MPSATTSVVVAGGANGGEQIALRHPHRDRRSARPRSRTSPPSRSTTTRSPMRRDRGSRAARARRPASRRTPSGGSGRARRRACSSGCSAGDQRPASSSRATNSSNSNACAATARAASVGTSARNSSRSVSRHDGSSPTIGTPRAAYGASAAIVRSASARAASSNPAPRYVRPQHSGRAPPERGLANVDRVPGRAQHALRGARDVGFEPAVERVDEQHHLAVRRGRRRARRRSPRAARETAARASAAASASR